MIYSFENPTDLCHRLFSVFQIALSVLKSSYENDGTNHYSDGTGFHNKRKSLHDYNKFLLSHMIKHMNLCVHYNYILYIYIIERGSKASTQFC